MTQDAAPARERFSGYHILLLALLGISTLYEGFDASMLTLASVDVRATLDIHLDEWGTIYAITRAGVVASFFFLMCADRFGRRALLLVTVAGFAIASGATAFVQTKAEFAFWQTVARLFLTAQYGLAIIIASEEFPAHLRGTGITILTAFATIGTVAMAKASPFFLLLKDAPGNPAHDFAMSLVAVGSSFLGIEDDGAHWRGLYLIGALPLLLLPFLRLFIRETGRYQEVAGQRGSESLMATLRAQMQGAAQLFKPRYLPRFRVVALLWNCVHLVTAPSVAFWAIYAREEVGMTPAQVGDVVMWAYIGGAFGHLLAGQLVDRLGRKLTCSVFYSIAAVAIVGLFHTNTTAGQYFWHICTVFFFNCAIGATHVYASELFPTELRATGYGWTTNLFGRVAEVFIPLLIGQLIPFMGISWGVTWVAIGPIIGALLVMKYAPETKGLTLEEIQERLEPEAGPENGATVRM
ncbi:MAG: MFS transporter [Pseudomonadales bacterium]|nr:MFS transporter [Pseudomonadales bacterium]MCP5184931.1 MFS transporter [Pseudomonadales bacterium]